MSFNINTSLLTEHYELKSKDISTQSVLGATTANLLFSTGNFQLGKPGQVPILKLDSTITLQEGGCGRTPSNTITPSNTFMVIKAIKSEENICPKDLYGSYFAGFVAAGQDPESETILPELASKISDKKIGDYQRVVENLIWHGDTTLTGSSNLKFIDGFVRQITVGGTASYISTSTTATTAKERLQAAFSKMPVEISSQEDFRIFCGIDMYNQYLLEIANANFFMKPDETTVLGTTAKLVPTLGLNNSKEIVSLRLSNTQIGMDLQGEESKATLEFAKEQKMWMHDIETSIGVKVIRTNEVGYVKY
ncbi:MAG: hypothetical protein EOO43_09550 [Flavobacterium sp.]|nr:MAG: hypothetical protein EOO43_09550 [Flavobacterium sp.]